ncbi:MAG: hypothetical protein LVR00_03895 [Rhabdochlamydiaceae bacterium]|jgi:methyl coenzyme M reductase subunit C
MLEAIIKARRPKDLLCVASNLMGPDERVISKPICEWTTLPDLQKKPAIFLLYNPS